jgi:uncharacterized delta-60 repeat protein
MAVFKTFNSQDIIISPLEVNKGFIFISSSNPPIPLPPINFGTGFDQIVRELAIQSDGKILTVGTFSTYQGITSRQIIRLNVDGSIDTSFDVGTGFINGTQTITIQPDGKILVGGTLISYKGITSNRIIRLNTDGSIDTSFDIGTGFNNTVFSITIQPDDKILVGGNFTTYKGITSNRIIRLNIDGSIDTSFDTGTGFNNYPSSITIQPDDKILVGGNFTTYKGITSNRIIRLNIDGSIDTSFDIGTGFNHTVSDSNAINEIAIQPDDKILVGGNFTTYKGITSNRIIRLNIDGSIDTSFDTGTGFNNYPSSITIQPDDKILVGGSFGIYRGLFYNRIIRLNIDGSIDTSFNIGNGFNFSVEDIKIRPDGKIVVVGTFTTYQGISSNRIIELNPDGTRSSI